MTAYRDRLNAGLYDPDPETRKAARKLFEAHPPVASVTPPSAAPPKKPVSTRRQTKPV